VAAAHPPFKAMVKAAVKALKERNGSSRQAILKYIVANYKVGDAAKAQVRVRLCLKKMVAAKTLVHGGAAGKKGAGCFKLAAKAEKEVKKAKKPKAKKPKAAKKAAKPKAAKKPAAKKAAKPKAAKPKKAPAAKKPAAAKKAAKPKAAKKPAAAKPKAAKPKAAKPKAAKKA
jgi:histone H1/5